MRYYRVKYTDYTSTVEHRITDYVFGVCDWEVIPAAVIGIFTNACYKEDRTQLSTAFIVCFGNRLLT